MVIEHVFTDGLLWQATCWKLGTQRGVRLSQCPCVPWWLCIPGMEVGILQAFREGSSPVVQDLHDLLLTARQSSLLGGGLSESLSLINECLCP